MEMDSDSEKINNEETEVATEYQIIPVQLVESYHDGSVTLSSPTNTLCTSSPNLILGNISKGKYYKQTYRPAWEQMPDFKGWLKGVEGEPTRAYCTYCHKSLHAHRLSLLKHTCTIRHQKAAQFYSSKKNTWASLKKSDSSTVVQSDESAQNEEPENEGEEENVEFAEAIGVGEGGTEFDFEDDYDEEDEENDKYSETLRNQKVAKLRDHLLKPAVSTQVTDMSKGRPVTGLQVSLYKLIDGRWTYINEGVTGSNGMFADFLSRNDFTLGRYKLHYDVDRYFEARKQETMYPFIEIVFNCTAFTETYHIPLLLSPYGYTTYKGS